MFGSRLSIPRVGSSNLSECARGNHHKSLADKGLSVVSSLRANRPQTENARGSKRTLDAASRRKVPDKVPDKPRTAYEAARRTDFVYFIHGGGLIKIGYSRTPFERFRALSATIPLELALLFLLPGNRKLELKLHERFAADRRMGEWFLLSDALFAFLAENLEGRLGGEEHLDLLQRSYQSQNQDHLFAACSGRKAQP